MCKSYKQANIKTYTMSIYIKTKYLGVVSDESPLLSMLKGSDSCIILVKDMHMISPQAILLRGVEKLRNVHSNMYAMTFKGII